MAQTTLPSSPSSAATAPRPSLIARLLGPLPDWARRDHPIMRYELQSAPRPTRSVRLLRAFGNIMVVIAALLVGYFAATGLLTQPAGTNPVEMINNVLYLPTLGLQLAVSIGALLLTIGAVAREERRNTWDNLRATPAGAELALRVRWASVFYRLRPLIAVIMLVRVTLILLLLWDLTAFQGRYIDLLISGITPQMDVTVAVLLLALLMTASLLLPFTSVGFDAALGILIATYVRQRTYMAILLIVVIAVKLYVAFFLLTIAGSFLNGMIPPSDALAWSTTFGAAALGDGGLSMLYLGRSGEMWATIPYGILFGAALIVFALLQAFLADQMVAWACRRAVKRG